MKTCVVCGEKTATKKIIESAVSVKYGSVEKFKKEILACSTCNEEICVTKDKVVRGAYRKSKITAVENMMALLLSKGTKMMTIERLMGLRFGSLVKLSKKDKFNDLCHAILGVALEFPHVLTKLEGRDLFNQGRRS